MNSSHQVGKNKYVLKHINFREEISYYRTRSIGNILNFLDKIQSEI